MNYDLKELIDIPTVQRLLDSLDEINRLPSAILDIEGNILTATSWQDICTKFHRINPDTIKKCTESDTRIELRIGESASPVMYRCPMGLVDSASPIIVEGKHIGNVFLGQLFIDPPDELHFIEQARGYGFEQSTYLEAMHKVPQCSEEQVYKNLKFLSNLVQVLVEEGLHRKRHVESENYLRESEKKLKVIFDTSDAGIIVVSPLGIITFANRRMADMFGLPINELVDTNYVDHLHESEKSAGTESLGRIIAGKVKSVELVRHYIRKDGTDFWGNLTGTRLENVDGTMRDEVIVISDITERKQAEEDKRSLEQQLQQAQKLESLGVLAGGIAHDFNNLMTVIMGSCFLMKMDTETALEQIPAIEKAAECAAELCRQMLAYAGKAPIAHSEVNLGELVGDMVGLLKTTISKNVSIIFNGASNIPLVKGDTSRLSQVVMNIIINASEAIGEMRGEIGISLSTIKICSDLHNKDCLGNVIPHGYYVCLDVSDNGSGMDDETKRRIFEPFYTTKFTGRGLGMSAILGIIKGHNGALQLTSQLGHGTTIKILLPAQIYEASSHKPSPPNVKNHWQGSGTILLVEDDKNILFAAKITLETFGFAVIGAANGKEALDLYRAHSKSIVIVMTDIGMPVMDGYELIAEMKRLSPNLPIVVASGFGNNIVNSRIPEKDIAGFINKPYNIDKIKDVLMRVIDGVSTTNWSNATTQCRPSRR